MQYLYCVAFLLLFNLNAVALSSDWLALNNADCVQGTRNCGRSLSPHSNETLTNADIIRMVKSGVSDSVVIGAIQANENKFDLSVNGILSLKSAGVSDAVIAVMQRFAGRQSVRRPSDRDSSLPNYGKIEEIKGLKRVYVSAEVGKARENIEKVLSKAKLFELTGDPNKADFVLEYRTLSRDVTSEKGNEDTTTRSQLTAYIENSAGRTITWSDTAKQMKFLSGGIGFQTKPNEIKLAEKFIKEFRKASIN